jgi:hypothetical protein
MPSMRLRRASLRSLCCWTCRIMARNSLLVVLGRWGATSEAGGGEGHVSAAADGAGGSCGGLACEGRLPAGAVAGWLAWLAKRCSNAPSGSAPCSSKARKSAMPKTTAPVVVTEPAALPTVPSRSAVSGEPGSSCARRSTATPPPRMTRKLASLVACLVGSSSESLDSERSRGCHPAPFALSKCPVCLSKPDLAPLACTCRLHASKLRAMLNVRGDKRGAGGRERPKPGRKPTKRLYRCCRTSGELAQTRALALNPPCPISPHCFCWLA